MSILQEGKQRSNVGTLVQVSSSRLSTLFEHRGTLRIVAAIWDIKISDSSFYVTRLMLYDCRSVTKNKKVKMGMFRVFRENYQDVLYLNDNVEIDYNFFITKYTEALAGMKELTLPVATIVYERLDNAIHKANERNNREIKFEDTDTEDESPEDDTNGQSDRAIVQKAELERFINRVQKRLKFLLVTETALLLNNVQKRKKFIRRILQSTRLVVSQVIGMIRRPPS